MNRVSNNPARLVLVDGVLRQCNGALRLPAFLSVTQARDVCGEFGLDFEDTDASVPVLSDGRIETAALARWLGVQA